MPGPKRTFVWKWIRKAANGTWDSLHHKLALGVSTFGALVVAVVVAWREAEWPVRYLWSRWPWNYGPSASAVSVGDVLIPVVLGFVAVVVPYVGFHFLAAPYRMANDELADIAESQSPAVARLSVSIVAPPVSPSPMVVVGNEGQTDYFQAEYLSPIKPLPHSLPWDRHDGPIEKQLVQGAHGQIPLFGRLWANADGVVLSFTVRFLSRQREPLVRDFEYIAQPS